MLGRLFIFIIVMFLVVTCEKESKRGSISIVAELDTSYATIGDIVQYRVALTGIGENLIHFPPWQLEDPVELRSMKIFGDKSGMNAEFQLVFWDTGYVTIPAYSVQILNPDSSWAYDFSADSLIIQVVSVVDHDPSMKQTGAGLRGVKDPVPVSVPWNRYRLLMIGLLILILAGMVFTWYRRVKPEGTRVEFPPELLEEADVVALRRLDILKFENWLDKEEVKEFYSRLSQILKEYVENSLYVRTLEMTTEEIQTNNFMFPYSEKEFDVMLNILKRADMVKFARQIPQISICGEDWHRTHSLVLETVGYWKIRYGDDEKD